MANPSLHFSGNMSSRHDYLRENYSVLISKFSLVYLLRFQSFFCPRLVELLHTLQSLHGAPEPQSLKLVSIGRLIGIDDSAA
jgi:hypothetical protein